MSWLEANLAAVIVADVRWYLDGRSGREAYDTGHLPGARFVDLDLDLAAPPSPRGGRHPLPTPDDFAAAMGRLGIDHDSRVVAYDDAGGSIAARLWWMLDAVGVAAAVLDGGITSWGGPIEVETPSWEPTTFPVVRWPGNRIATLDQVLGATRDEATVVLDARSESRFRGEPNAIDERFGHVPGAVSAPFAENLDVDGSFRTADELSRHYRALTRDTHSPIVYCGSGVTACHDLLAMRHAGISGGRLFVGSWSAWAADPDLPVESG